LLLALWARSRGLTLWRHDGTLAAGLLAGLFFAAEFACIFIGLQHTTASRMAVFIHLAPFVAAHGVPLIVPAAHLDRWQGLGLAATLLWGMTTLALRGSKFSNALPEKTLLYQLQVSGLALAATAAVSSETCRPSRC
jgi:drug/metabolite transporter (DMT)-like permease